MAAEAPARPERIKNEPLPAIPTTDDTNADQASVKLSHYRTGLSHHRTDLSEHRTDLSEYRTDLSDERTEMAMRRTGMAIHRTRMAADRTLMAFIRTSLSLIGFGFTLNEVFKRAIEAGAIHNAQSARNFGLTLIVLGILLLVGGILRHLQFSHELRARRRELVEDHLIHGQSTYPISTTLLTAIALLLVGVLAVASIVFDISFLG
ncbi:YidH family protein [Altererythrobacter sp. Root672]|uniref:YidH family protein n=1 Tax=Altererythrobacter sp. Root672 TaxID=1736584 RepID=UPI000701DC74|nr:DUF202 domain-containing protein [Altererythrobacter sp. Root672]KRA83888.1 hypothetical protein ASD76_07730 [Altererythrobacter sp. Root672]